MLVVLKPARFRFSAERYESVRVLWAQVLKRAIFDFVTLKGSSKLKDKRIFISAERWLFEDDGGLVDCCAVLEWPLEKLRARARAMTKKEIRKMEFLEPRITVDLLPSGSGRHGNS